MVVVLGILFVAFLCWAVHFPWVKDDDPTKLF